MKTPPPSGPKAVKRIVLALASAGLASLPQLAQANPVGGQVVAGTATIAQETPSKVAINQTSGKAIVDWRSFSIGANEQVQFRQPSASAVTLNRVVGEDPSKILGRLSANGQIFLVNPNGIYFGRNSQIDVAGLVASTHNIRNEDFMAGKYVFNLPGKPGASVVNEGTIRIADTGIAAFVAPSVANRGLIVARLGKVALAAANGFTLDFTGDKLLTFLVSDEVAKTAFDIEGTQLTSFVENSGKIEAQGGYVLLTAKAAENAIHGVINQSGVIEATSIGRQNGEIVLAGGQGGTVTQSGVLDASGTGGIVRMTGATNLNIKGSVTAGETIQIAAPRAVTYVDGGSLKAPNIQIDSFSLLGKGDIDSSGSSGGNVNINTGYLSWRGSIRADGSRGNAGTISLNASEALLFNNESAVTANSIYGRGGDISLTNTNGFALLSGIVAANGLTGGSISVTAPNVNLLGAQLHADGTNGGGTVLLGGDWQGGGTMSQAKKLLVDSQSWVTADATQDGNGGKLVFWSQKQTTMAGTATARGGIHNGDGGQIEVSSKELLNLISQPSAAARAAGGRAGNLLLDPKNIEINAAGVTGATVFQNLLSVEDATDSWSANSWFGSSVALNNNYALIGAGGYSARGISSGNAYLYNLITGAWIDLAATGGVPISWNASSLFGRSVALNNNYALIGADQSSARAFLSGNAYLYNLSSGTWTDLAATPGAIWNSGSSFGFSVALNSSHALIGAPAYQDGQFYGSAFLYNLSTRDWTTIAAPNSGSFGSSVALSNNYALIGAESQNATGGAYLYNLSTGVRTDLAATGGVTLRQNSYFGRSVALNNNYALVGAPFEDNAQRWMAGNAYLYNLTTGAWTNLAGVAGAPTRSNGHFGSSVALNSDYALLANLGESNVRGFGAGNAYLYNLSTGVWNNLAASSSAPASWNDESFFGVSVALNSNYALIGACNMGAHVVKGTANAYLYGWNGQIPLGFSDGPLGDSVISPSYLEAILGAGTNVTLAANNDITVNSAVAANNPSGDGGNLTFAAGRSITINANISTDNGNLNFIANETNDNGVQSAYRDAGAADITNNAILDAGTGNISFTIRSANASGRSGRKGAPGTITKGTTIAAHVAASTGFTAAQQAIFRKYDGAGATNMFNGLLIGDLINDQGDPVWNSLYQGGSATPAQVEADRLFNVYVPYGNASNSAVAADRLSGKLSGTNDPVWNALLAQRGAALSQALSDATPSCQKTNSCGTPIGNGSNSGDSSGSGAANTSGSANSGGVIAIPGCQQTNSCATPIGSGSNPGSPSESGAANTSGAGSGGGAIPGGVISGNRDVQSFFNSADINVATGNITLLPGRTIELAGHVFDTMSLIEYLLIGNYNDAGKQTVKIVAAKLIPLFGQLSTAADTGEWLAKQLDTMLTNQSYGAFVHLLNNSNPANGQKPSFTWLEAQEFFRSGPQIYGSGGFALGEIRDMVTAGYFETSGFGSDVTYTLSFKGALAIYGSLVPPKKDGVFGMYGKPTYEGVAHDYELLSQLQRAIAPAN